MAKPLGWVVFFAAAMIVEAQYTKNPAEAVVNLMVKLKKQIQKEGKTEAAAYDKFACFCKDQADEKLYSITKKTKRIDELDANIKKLTADIADFTSQKEKAEKKRTQREAETKAANEKDVRDHDFYLKHRADKEAAIVALGNATEVIKGAGDNVDEDGPAAASAAASSASSMLELGASAGDLKEAMAVLTKEDPAAYAFKGGKTLKLLETLHAEFIKDLKRLEDDEVDRKHDVSMANAARLNEIMGLSAKITKCQNIIGQKSTEKSEDENEKGNLESDRADDQAFMDKLTSECEDKAGKWDIRSKRRFGELTAISQALEILKGGVKNYGANRKLAGVQKKAVVAVAKKALSFLQLASVSDDQLTDKQTSARRAAATSLMSAAKRLQSSSLFTLVLRIKGGAKGPFDSVKNMIEDLITKIDDEQSDEEAEIEACKNDITSATQARADNTANIEEQQATILGKGRKASMHESNGQELTKDISELFKAKNEATELRAKEKLTNEKCLEEARVGEDSVGRAMNVLKDFYDSPAFLQEPTSNDPDTIGSGDDFLGGDGEGGGGDVSKQDDAKGILGLLGTIKKDYSDTISSVTKEEEDAETEFDSFKSGAESSIGSKEDEKASQKRAKKQAQEDVETANFDLEGYKEGLAQAVYELSILNPRCLGLGASQKERKARREEEKAALQEAITILSAMAPAEAKNTDF